MPLQLSERQQTTVATALTILAAGVIVVALVAFFWLIGAFLDSFANVFLPLAVAAVAALVFKPYFELLRRRLHLPPVAALVVVFLSIVIPVAAFLTFFGALIVDQIADLVQRTPEWARHVAEQVNARLPQIERFIEDHQVVDRLQSAASGQVSNLVGGLQSFGTRALSAGAGILRRAAGLLGWVVLPVYFSFFLLADPHGFRRLEAYLPFLKQETRRDVVYLLEEFVSIVVAFFRGQLIIAMLQGLLFAIGFTAVGLSYGFVLGLALGFLNIIPYLGNIVGLGVALPLAFFQTDGGLVRLALVIGVFVFVQTIEGYLLTPRIMGDRTGLHPMVIIVAIFFWGSALGGIFGMILAIPLTAFLVVFWRLARDKYVSELV